MTPRARRQVDGQAGRSLDGPRHDRHERRIAVTVEAGEGDEVLADVQRHVADQIELVTDAEQPLDRAPLSPPASPARPTPPGRRAQRPRHELVQRVVVRRRPVVGVDEQVAQRFRALVDVGDTRAR